MMAILSQPQCANRVDLDANDYAWAMDYSGQFRSMSDRIDELVQERHNSSAVVNGVMSFLH